MDSELDINDIVIVSIKSGGSGGRKKPLTKSSRKDELRTETVVVEHTPSRQQFERTIPMGHYSKKEMQRLRENVRKEFFDLLTGSKKEL